MDVRAKIVEAIGEEGLAELRNSTPKKCMEIVVSIIGKEAVDDILIKSAENWAGRIKYFDLGPNKDYSHFSINNFRKP
jgi:hypothetical protein